MTVQMKFAAEQQKPEGKGGNGELGFDCCPYNNAVHGYGNATIAQQIFDE